MGIKEGDGVQETLLKSTGEGISPVIASGSIDTVVWSISYSGGYYYISNNHFDTNELTGSYGSTTITCKSLDNENAYSRWSLEKIERNTFNNYFTGSLLGQGNNINIKINLITTGSDSVYLNGVISNSNVAFANYGLWNNVSSHVTIYGPNDTVPSGTNAFQVDVKGSTSLDDVSGKAHLYYYDVLMDLDDDATRAEILLNVSLDSDLRDNPQRQSEVFLHELGHVLKLAHPKETVGLMPIYNGRGAYSGDNKVIGLMNNGNATSGGNLSCRVPKWHDKINLKNRWGD